MVEFESVSHRDAITTSTARKTSSPARGCPSVLRSELALATDDPRIFDRPSPLPSSLHPKGDCEPGGAYRKGTTTSKEDRSGLRHPTDLVQAVYLAFSGETHDPADSRLEENTCRKKSTMIAATFLPLPP